MLKISRKATAGGEVVLRLEGTLGGAWVAELRAACDALIHERQRVVLDLGGVTFVPDPTHGWGKEEEKEAKVK